jgi:hypothetical protein
MRASAFARSRFSLLLALLSLVVCSRATAQSDSSSFPVSLWFQCGVGLVSTGGLGGEISAGFHVTRWGFVTVREQGGGSGPGDPALDSQFESLEALFGIRTPGRYLTLSLSAGISSFQLTTYPGEGVGPDGVERARRLNGSKIGFPLEVALVLRPFRFLGVGVRYFSIPNRILQVKGATCFVQLGMFW